MGSARSDGELVARCRAGDHDAWRALVERFSRYVYAIAVQGYRLEPSDAEDVFQEVFARAYEQLASLRDDGSVRPWLAQLARRLCVDRLRQRAREHAVDEPPEAADVERTIERLHEALAVREALETLNAPCREILDRFFARDESYLTIGRELGIPPGTIASRISRCLQKLREAMDGRRERAGASRGR